MKDNNQIDKKLKKRRLIRAEEICKGYSYRGRHSLILNKVSLKIDYSQTLAIVGTSGIGKSTILHILGTLDKPDSGKLWFKNKNILALNDVSLARFRNKKVGFVFQFHHLLNDFSALENTMMPLLIGKVPTKIAREKAKILLLRVGMKKRMQHKPTQLSGGERQRVAIARALIQNPLILLADEPTGNLDRSNSKSIQKLLLQLNEEFHMALVLVTHNDVLASSMSKQITISEGKLLDV